MGLDIVEANCKLSLKLGSDGADGNAGVGAGAGAGAGAGVGAT